MDNPFSYVFEVFIGLCTAVLPKKKKRTYKYTIDPLIIFAVILIFTNNKKGIYLWSRSTMVY